MKKLYLSRKHQEQGSILVLALFVTTVISIMGLSYWKMIQMNTRILMNKEKSLQAYYLARGGIEDAIHELRQGHTWSVANLGGPLDVQWKHNSTLHPPNLFYKTTEVPVVENPLSKDRFNYPATVYVSVTGDPETSTVNIVATGEVKVKNDPTSKYVRVLKAKVARNPSGEVFIFELTE